MGYVSQLAGPTVPDAAGWAGRFLGVELDLEVPAEIRELFDIARGCMVYGWFYYPLYALGEQQLFRVLEAASARCYRDAGGTNTKLVYHDRLERLDRCGVLPPGDLPRWQAARQLRNAASHLSEASVMPPGAVYEQLRQSAWDINAIFRRVHARPAASAAPDEH